MDSHPKLTRRDELPVELRVDELERAFAAFLRTGQLPPPAPAFTIGRLDDVGDIGLPVTVDELLYAAAAMLAVAAFLLMVRVAA
jgi:hypothetical protein